MSSVNPNKPKITTSSTQANISERTQVIVPLTNQHPEAIQQISQAPGYLLSDANACRDLVEYGDKLKLENSQTPSEQIVFLENQKSADDKFTGFLKSAPDVDLIHGDVFLRELLQADITEIEKKPSFLSAFKNKGKETLPLLEFSKKDSNGELCQEEEDKFKALLSNLYKIEIANYLNKAPKDRIADDYIERIRRILRTNARIIDENSLPRNLSGAWQTEADRGQTLTRRLFLTGAGLTAIGGGTAAFLNRQNQIQNDVIDSLRNKSVREGYRISTMEGSDQKSISDALNGFESQCFNELVKIVHKEQSIDINEQNRSVKYTIPDNSNISKSIYVFKTPNVIHVRIQPEVFIDYVKYRDSNQFASEDDQVKFLKPFIKSRGK